MRAVDQLSGTEHRIFAKKIINATGPWVDVLRKEDGSMKGKTLRLTKGVHLVFDSRRFPLKQAVYFDTPDGRMVFAIPRAGKTYVGTTDTVEEKEIQHPRMTEEDRQYLIQAIQFMFPQLQISVEDIESSWAGLRPLIHQEGKAPSEISRKDEVWVSHSGLISIAGGKLTGYRKMAENVVDLVCDQLKKEEGLDYGKCQTKVLPISGGEIGGVDNYETFVAEQARQGVSCGLTEQEARELAARYGSNVGTIFEIIEQGKSEAEAFHMPLKLYGSLVYALRYEMVIKPTDFFIRRTGALLFEIEEVRLWKDPVLHYMAHVFGWTKETKEIYAAELEQQLHDAVQPLSV